MEISIHSTKEHGIKIGQFWRLKEEPHRVFLVADTLGDEPFSLIELNDGEAWHHPSSNLNDIFGELKDSFELIENSKITITI